MGKTKVCFPCCLDATATKDGCTFSVNQGTCQAKGSPADRNKTAWHAQQAAGQGHAARVPQRTLSSPHTTNRTVPRAWTLPWPPRKKPDPARHCLAETREKRLITLRVTETEPIWFRAQRDPDGRLDGPCALLRMEDGNGGLAPVPEGLARAATPSQLKTKPDRGSSPRAWYTAGTPVAASLASRHGHVATGGPLTAALGPCTQDQVSKSKAQRASRSWKRGWGGDGTNPERRSQSRARGEREMVTGLS